VSPWPQGEWALVDGVVPGNKNKVVGFEDMDGDISDTELYYRLLTAGVNGNNLGRRESHGLDIPAEAPSLINGFGI